MLWAGWSHWDGQSRHRKAWLGQEQGQESRELQLWVPLSAQGPSHRLSLVPAQQWQQHQQGAVVFSSNQKCPFPTAWRGWGHTPGDPPCAPKLHRRQRSEPSGVGGGASPFAPCPGDIPAATEWDLGSAGPQEHLHTSQQIQALPKDPIFSFLPLSSCITLWLTSGYFGFLCILLAVPWTAVEWGLDLMIQNYFRGKNQAVKSILCWVQLSSSPFSSKLSDSS